MDGESHLLPNEIMVECSVEMLALLHQWFPGRGDLFLPFVQTLLDPAFR